MRGEAEEEDEEAHGQALKKDYRTKWKENHEWYHRLKMRMKHEQGQFHEKEHHPGLGPKKESGQ